MVGVGGQAKGRFSLPLVLCSQQVTEMYTIHRMDQDGYWQQFGIPPILIDAPKWLHRPCNVLTWFYRVGKKPSVKADLAIYSYVRDVSGHYMSVSLILGFNWTSVLVQIGTVFANSVTYNYVYRIVHVMIKSMVQITEPSCRTVGWCHDRLQQISGVNY